MKQRYHVFMPIKHGTENRSLLDKGIRMKTNFTEKSEKISAKPLKSWGILDGAEGNQEKMNRLDGLLKHSVFFLKRTAPRKQAMDETTKNNLMI